MKFSEVEYKYKADHISLGQFMELISTNFEVVDIVTARGTDKFYVRGDGEFARYRTGGGWNDNCELTIKQKTTKGNSWSRVEVDLPLNKNKVDEPTVTKFLTLMGFTYSFSLVKLNYVIRTPRMTFAYYVVDRKDAYLEVEANKGTFSSEEEAFDLLNSTEKKLEKLGISYRNRTKLSLFEMYKAA